MGDRRKRLVVAEDLYTALERRELTVEYQPILHRRGRASSAPRRWCAGTTRPAAGCRPAEFLEAAERYKLTPAIAERVLDVALGDLAPLAARRRRADRCR